MHPAIKRAFEHLDALPSMFTYHNKTHTENVMKYVKYLCKKEALSAKDTNFLIIAAAYHDLGYIVDPDNHVEESMRIAQEELSAYEFDIIEIMAIVRLIEVTDMPQKPKNIMEKIICDADLSSLGRKIFKQTSKDLLQELRNLGQTISDEDWKKTQINFLKSHKYWTKTFQHEMRIQKELNLKELL